MISFIRYIIFLVFASMSLSVFSEPIIIAVENKASPWSNEDGKGFANDIVTAAFSASGVQIKLSVVPYARCKYLAINGDVTACFSMSSSPEFTDTISFANQPLFICSADYFYNSKKPLNAFREEDFLKGTVLGVVRGYEYPSNLTNLLARGIVVLDESNSEESSLRKLAAGRVDAVLINHNDLKSFEAMARNAGVSGQIIYGFHGGVLASYIGFSKKHPKGIWALEKFNQGYKVISKNGVLTAINTKWKVLANH